MGKGSKNSTQWNMREKERVFEIGGRRVSEKEVGLEAGSKNSQNRQLIALFGSGECVTHS